MLLDEKAINEIRISGYPVAIFGAGIVGEAIYHACFKAGIRIDYFCDNNVNKTKSLLCGKEVFLPEDLRKKHADAVILISAADINDVVKQLRELGFIKFYSGSALLRNFDLSPIRFSTPLEFAEYAVATCLLCHDSYLRPDNLFLRSVDIIITERCTLKCRHCSNLMQYYKKPSNCSFENLMVSLSAFCAIADEINEFRVIGGEPFMNKDIHFIVEKLIGEPKVKKAVIYTNGTIVPDKKQIKYFKDNKVLFIITDYGKLSRRLNDLIGLLQAEGIDFYVHKAQGWTDCAAITKHSRGLYEQKEVFRACCAKNTITLSDGKLYRCPFSANVDRLSAVPAAENDHIDILGISESSGNVFEAKKIIRNFIAGIDFLRVCDYCNGRPFNATEIVSAEQIDRPLDYIMYNNQVEYEKSK